MAAGRIELIALRARDNNGVWHEFNGKGILRFVVTEDKTEKVGTGSVTYASVQFKVEEVIL